MSLKAGRVGVNPADVDPIDGHISPLSLAGYTKQEADAKFETQEAAAALQPKTLAVPIQMLSGSKLTVETALQGLNEEKSVVDGWSTPVLIPVADTALDGLGVIKYSENPSIHLAFVKWEGNASTPASENVVINYDDMTERPILELASVLRGADYISTAYSNEHCTVRVVLRTNSWSGGYLLFPTQPK